MYRDSLTASAKSVELRKELRGAIPTRAGSSHGLRVVPLEHPADREPLSRPSPEAGAGPRPGGGRAPPRGAVLDEGHPLVGGERPAVVRNEALELGAGRAQRGQ